MFSKFYEWHSITGIFLQLVYFVQRQVFSDFSMSTHLVLDHEFDVCCPIIWGRHLHVSVLWSPVYYNTGATHCFSCIPYTLALNGSSSAWLVRRQGHVAKYSQVQTPCPTWCARRRGLWEMIRSWNGMSCPDKRRPRELSPSPLLPREGTRRRWLSMNQEAGSHQTLNLPAPWSQMSQPPELWERHVVLCYSSLNGEEHGTIILSVCPFPGFCLCNARTLVLLQLHQSNIPRTHWAPWKQRLKYVHREPVSRLWGKGGGSVEVIRTGKDV